MPIVESLLQDPLNAWNRRLAWARGDGGANAHGPTGSLGFWDALDKRNISRLGSRMGHWRGGGEVEGGVVSAFCGGSLSGALQWLALRRRLSSASRWAMASMLGCGGGVLTGLAVESGQ